MTAGHVVASAVLVSDGSVLLAHRRADRAWYPDCWDLVGGHVEPGETPEATVVRECREELGVELVEPSPIPMTVTDPDVEMCAFVATCWHGEPTNLAPDEHDDVRWFTVDDLPHLTLADPTALPDIIAAVSRRRR